MTSQAWTSFGNRIGHSNNCFKRLILSQTIQLIPSLRGRNVFETIVYIGSFQVSDFRYLLSEETRHMQKVWIGSVQVRQFQ